MEKYAVFWKKCLNTNLLKIKNIIKVEIIVIIQMDIKVLHVVYVTLKYSISKETTLLFHNTSNYDYHFIIKEVAEEFEENLLVLEKILKNT